MKIAIIIMLLAATASAEVGTRSIKFRKTEQQPKAAKPVKASKPVAKPKAEDKAEKAEPEPEKPAPKEAPTKDEMQAAIEAAVAPLATKKELAAATTKSAEIAVTAANDPRVVDAEVRVDGERWGLVPVSGTTTVGRHQIVIAKAGFHPYAMTVDTVGKLEVAPSFDETSIARIGRRPAPSRVFASFGVALPVYVYTQPIAGAQGIDITPDKNLSVGQAVALGYVASPRFSIVASGIFLETVQADKGGKTGWGFGAASVFGSLRLVGGLSVGAGPLYWYRTGFQTKADYGAYFTLGYRAQLPSNFSLTFAINSPQSWINTPAIVIAPGIALSRRL